MIQKWKQIQEDSNNSKNKLAKIESTIPKSTSKGGLNDYQKFVNGIEQFVETIKKSATPEDATKLVKALKKEVKIPLELHSHCTAGICEMTYKAAIEAGVDIIDCSVTPLSNGTGQPSVQAFQV